MRKPLQLREYYNFFITFLYIIRSNSLCQNIFLSQQLLSLYIVDSFTHLSRVLLQKAFEEIVFPEAILREQESDSEDNMIICHAVSFA